MTNTNYVRWPSFDEIAEMFKEHFIITRTPEGVCTVRMHTNGGPLIWSMELHDAIGKMWRMLGTDRDTEVIIFTGTDDIWVSDFEAESWMPETTDPVNTRYDHMFIDGRRMLISMIHDVEVPTIGVLSGSGGHTELALMCDFAIAADDIKILDPHVLVGNVPGDGIHSCFFELMPYRQAVWYLMTGDMMTAEDALKYGLVSELVPRENLMDRANEIAGMLMKQNRIVRRLSTQVMRRKWKQRIVDDLDMAFGTEMLGCFSDSHEHSFMPSVNEMVGKQPNYQGNTKLPVDFQWPEGTGPKH
ncbi:enoyl-CoA hydratase/isomerase family protein [Actinotalea sp. M2MS4P-6]|uniref:enoyl-CoA hydratase/isomerase family protein n=1 Tax=Actinotalea sp. M2MS4P-6 TaxID=2983762 RepID=UPI0021E43028|nr:enoyl-CoA hydratase/isomerase family protein [Actinotalea sp. M2MS4P-6]MCV2395116.1 enoyl-CoA hydratase/isomerase family protein [Actinotalea sp. M2MS4P-6]